MATTEPRTQTWKQFKPDITMAPDGKQATHFSWFLSTLTSSHLPFSTGLEQLFFSLSHNPS